MLFLLFHLGDDRYALDIKQVAEVLPLVDITPLPRTPDGVAGIFNYRGMPIPAIDLSPLTVGRLARNRLNTRVVLVHCPDTSGETHLLGLIAEKATETVRLERSDFVSSGTTSDRTAFLGPVAVDAGGMLRRIDVQKLLPALVREALLGQPVAC